MRWETDRYPHPLTQEEIMFNHLFLSDTQVTVNGFLDYGMVEFWVSPEDRAFYGLQFWSDKLLGVNPEQWDLLLKYQGSLLLQPKGIRRLFKQPVRLSPFDIAQIRTPIGGIMVGREGFLLSERHADPNKKGARRFNLAYQNPVYDTTIKILEEGYEGQTVSCIPLLFYHPQNREQVKIPAELQPVMDKVESKIRAPDCVILDENLKLLKRELNHTFKGDAPRLRGLILPS